MGTRSTWQAAGFTWLQRFDLLYLFARRNSSFPVPSSRLSLAMKEWAIARWDRLDENRHSPNEHKLFKILQHSALDAGQHTSCQWLAPGRARNNSGAISLEQSSHRCSMIDATFREMCLIADCIRCRALCATFKSRMAQGFWRFSGQSFFRGTRFGGIFQKRNGRLLAVDIGGGPASWAHALPTAILLGIRVWKDRKWMRWDQNIKSLKISASANIKGQTDLKHGKRSTRCLATFPGNTCSTLRWWWQRWWAESLSGIREESTDCRKKESLWSWKTYIYKPQVRSALILHGGNCLKDRPSSSDLAQTSYSQGIFKFIYKCGSHEMKSICNESVDLEPCKADPWRNTWCCHFGQVYITSRYDSHTASRKLEAVCSHWDSASAEQPDSLRAIFLEAARQIHLKHMDQNRRKGPLYGIYTAPAWYLGDEPVRTGQSPSLSLFKTYPFACPAGTRL